MTDQVNEGQEPAKPVVDLEAQYAAKANELAEREKRVNAAMDKLAYVDQIARNVRGSQELANLADALASGRLTPEQAAAALGQNKPHVDPEDPVYKALTPVQRDVQALREQLAAIEGRNAEEKRQNQISEIIKTDPVLATLAKENPGMEKVFRRNLLDAQKENPGLGVAEAAHALSQTMRSLVNKQTAVNYEQAKSKAQEPVVPPSTGGGGTVNAPQTPPTSFFKGGRVSKDAVAQSRAAVLAKIKALGSAPNP